jgi:hypothetical protein
LTYINLLGELGFIPLSIEERDRLTEWAGAVNSPYSDMVLRLLRENAFHIERFVAYQIIEKDVLDSIVQQKMEEKGWSWT